jgi:hypothetical protein
MSLIAAVQEGHPDLLRRRIKLFFNRHRHVDSEVDDYGCTALGLAVLNGDYQCCKVLIESGANLEYRDFDHWTPLISASVAGHHKCVELLLSHGAYIDVQDTFQFTPLIYAAQNGREHCISVLLKYGANTTHRNMAGRTALLEAQHRLDNPSLMNRSSRVPATQNNYVHCIELLQEYDRIMNTVQVTPRSSSSRPGTCTPRGKMLFTETNTSEVFNDTSKPRKVTRRNSSYSNKRSGMRLCTSLSIHRRYSSKVPDAPEHDECSVPEVQDNVPVADLITLADTPTFEEEEVHECEVSECSSPLTISSFDSSPVLSQQQQQSKQIQLSTTVFKVKPPKIDPTVTRIRATVFTRLITIELSTTSYVTCIKV